jgi:hypothetical protein
MADDVRHVSSLFGQKCIVPVILIFVYDGPSYACLTDILNRDNFDDVPETRDGALSVVKGRYNSFPSQFWWTNTVVWNLGKSFGCHVIQSIQRLWSNHSQSHLIRRIESRIEVNERLPQINSLPFGFFEQSLFVTCEEFSVWMIWVLSLLVDLI